MAQVCQRDRAFGIASGLTIKGKGGLPAQPIEPFDTDDGKIILTAYAIDNLNSRTPGISANCSISSIN
ncbi:MAG: hypothetical protein AAGA80_02420 [Cyanobacteria bacterium P01_F01_bin.143]